MAAYVEEDRAMRVEVEKLTSLVYFIVYYQASQPKTAANPKSSTQEQEMHTNCV